ncbi:MAG: monovalent cation/H+ antiporter subunit D family protein [Acidimicrobiia bacterium]|nr:monovalent cation/H+ antiporter subunit D family protein [Acidimicrobiia bacterium]MBM4134982.1 monovalent cation/H+ antiporter subunit D family protein [Nitrospira sp.]
MTAIASPERLVLVAVLVPFVGALVIPAFHKRPNLRETVTLTTAGLLCAVVFSLLGPVIDGARPEANVFAIAPGLAVALKVEPLGMLFALVASTLWVVNSIYSIGYMRGNDEPRQTGFYVCFALALTSTIGVAFAGNLFTLFLFYEALTLVTYPLVTHKGNTEAIRAGRLYLVLLLGTSLVLFLPAIVATWVLAGTLNFAPGGILAGKTSPAILGVLLALFVFGIGKAALIPVHFWLPAAMVAPTPVSALLHAVAVVKAGVFAVTKVVVYVFGLDTLRQAGANEWLVFVASMSLLLASLIALSCDNLKARLAYSTVSQLAYVVLGAAIATTTSILGAGLQIAVHAVAKITLFFCAGAIYTAHHLTEVSQLNGIGRKMPITMLAFLAASLSIIGVPPLGGWNKWTLALGAADAGQMIALGAIMLSSLLSVGYLLPIVARGFFPSALEGESSKGTRIKEAPLACVIALGCTALLTVALFFSVGRVEQLLLGL